MKENGIIDQQQLETALTRQTEWQKRIGETLVELGFITDNTLMRVLSKFFNVPSLNLEEVQVGAEVLRLVPYEMAKEYRVVPVALKKITHVKRLVLAMSDPGNLAAIDEIQFSAGYPVMPVICTMSGIDSALIRYYRGGEQPSQATKPPQTMSTELPVKPVPESGEVEQSHSIDVTEVSPAPHIDEMGDASGQYLLAPNDLDELDDYFANLELPEVDLDDSVEVSAVSSASQSFTGAVQSLVQAGQLSESQARAIIQSQHPAVTTLRQLMKKSKISEEEFLTLLLSVDLETEN